MNCKCIFFIILFSFNVSSILTVSYGKYGNVYGNFVYYAYSQSISTLKRWVTIISIYIRSAINTSSLCGINLKTYTTKEDLINILLFLINEYPSLYNIENFHRVIGMTNFQSYIHNQTEISLREIAFKLYQYNGIKQYKLKQYDYLFTLQKFNDVILDNGYDVNSVKLYIFTISSMFPELKIINVFNEVLSSLKSGEDKFYYEETITNDKLTLILNTYERDEELKIIMYKFIRFHNSSIPFNNRKDIEPDLYSRIQKIEYIKNIYHTYENILSKDWNFARLITDYTSILYEGLTSFIFRQSHSHLLNILNALRKEEGAHVMTESQFFDLSHDMQVKYIMYFITDVFPKYNRIQKLKEVIIYNTIEKASNGNITFKDKSVKDLKQYALLCEMYIREKKRLDLYGSIYEYLHELSRSEIEDYIARFYSELKEFVGIEGVEDFDVYVNVMDLDTVNEYLE